MGAGGPARRADLADQVPLTQFLAGPHGHPRLMEVHAHQALSVVDHHEAALKMQAGFRETDGPCCRCDNPGAPWSGEVCPIVWALGFAVQDSLTPEPARDPRGPHGKNEPAAKAIPVDTACQTGLLSFALGLDQLEQGGIFRADLVLGQSVNPLDVEVPPGDLEPVAGRSFPGGDSQIRARAGVPVKANDETAPGRGLADRLAIQPELCSWRGDAECEAALLIAAVDGQPWSRPQGRPGQGGGPETEKRGPAIQGLSSRQRLSASAGPA